MKSSDRTEHRLLSQAEAALMSALESLQTGSGDAGNALTDIYAAAKFLIELEPIQQARREMKIPAASCGVSGTEMPYGSLRFAAKGSAPRGGEYTRPDSTTASKLC